MEHILSNSANTSSEIDNIIYTDITGTLSRYADQLSLFIELLSEEKRYFKLDMARVYRSELIVIAETKGEIVGIVGIERKFFLPRSYIMLKSDYHGRALGRIFILKLMDLLEKKRYHLVMALTDENNIPGLRLHATTGYRICGKRQNLYYQIKTLDDIGRLSFPMIRLAIPISNLIAALRRTLRQAFRPQ